VKPAFSLMVTGRLSRRRLRVRAPSSSLQRYADIRRGAVTNLAVFQVWLGIDNGPGARAVRLQVFLAILEGADALNVEKVGPT
jgi:hypothetical protein